MTKLSNEQQLIKSLKKYFLSELKAKLIDTHGEAASQKAFKFSERLIISDDNIKERIELITAAILKVKLSKSIIQALLNNLDSIPHVSQMINTIFREVNAQFVNDDQPKFNNQLSSEAKKSISDDITLQFKTAFAKADLRVYDTHERRVRRMDSLALLFSISNSLSVCSSVTFYHGKLLIAANLGKESDREKVLGSLKNRFDIICEFIAEIKELKTSEVVQVADEFYDKLVAVGGSGLQRDAVTQAMRKLAHAVWKDTETLPENFRKVFTDFEKSNYLILLPALSASNKPLLRVSNYLDISRDHEIEGQQDCNSIRLLHAEQLIAWFIFKIHADSQETLELLHEDALKLPFGISKLCCRTCKDELSELPIVTRGTHQQIYFEVMAFFNHTKEIRHPMPQQVVTHAERSHPGTILSSISPAQSSLSFVSFNGSSQPYVESCSRAVSSRSYSFFPTESQTLEQEKSAISKPAPRGAYASRSDSGFKSDR